MTIYAIDLTKVSFPVFKLGNTPPLFSDGVVFYHRIYHEDEVEVHKVSVVDDKSIEKDTLSARRLELLNRGVRLKKLRLAIFFIADLLKLSSSGGNWFIDNAGQVFQYKKTKYVNLIFRKIKNIIPIRTGGAIIEVDGILSRFKTLYLPDTGNIYAGLIQYGMGYVLYGTYPHLPKNTRRMI